MRRTLLFLCLCLPTLASHGEEAERPAFSKPPILFIHKHRIRDAGGTVNRVQDELLIGDRNNRELKFWFSLTGPNLHICSMSGRAQTAGANRYVATEGPCEMTITFTKDMAVLSDRDAQCKHLHCGTRAYIEGARFSRAVK
jgi:hypothetical protein